MSPQLELDVTWGRVARTARTRSLVLHERAAKPLLGERRRRALVCPRFRHTSREARCLRQAPLRSRTASSGALWWRARTPIRRVALRRRILRAARSIARRGHREATRKIPALASAARIDLQSIRRRSDHAGQLRPLRQCDHRTAVATAVARARDRPIALKDAHIRRPGVALGATRPRVVCERHRSPPVLRWLHAFETIRACRVRAVDAAIAVVVDAVVADLDASRLAGGLDDCCVTARCAVSPSAQVSVAVTPCDERIRVDDESARRNQPRRADERSNQPAHLHRLH